VTDQHTPWSTVLNRLIVTCLVKMSLFLPKWGFITVFMISACHWTMSQINPGPYKRIYPNLKPFVTCLWWGVVSPPHNPTFLWPSIRHSPCILRMCHALVTKNARKSFTSLPYISISKHICKAKSNNVLVSSWTSVCMVQHDSHLTDFMKFIFGIFVTICHHILILPKIIQK
jgi:hypothetical protein